MKKTALIVTLVAIISYGGRSQKKQTADNETVAEIEYSTVESMEKNLITEQPAVENIETEISGEKGVVINGVRWATRNVDAPGTFAHSSRDAGMFYQWGRNVGWPTDFGKDPGEWNDSDEQGDVWTETNDPCPTGWRVPTIDEFAKLCDEEKVTIELMDSPGPANGMSFTDKNTGNSLFLLAVGDRTDTSMADPGHFGYYWSNKGGGPYTAYHLYFDENIFLPTERQSRRFGFPLRCVVK